MKTTTAYLQTRIDNLLQNAAVFHAEGRTGDRDRALNDANEMTEAIRTLSGASTSMETQYRDLVRGEVIQEGDEFFTPDTGTWHPASLPGGKYDPFEGGLGRHYRIRRRITPSFHEEAEALILSCKNQGEIVRALAAWMDTATQNQRNTGFYRDIVTRIGEMFGDEAKRSDDGSMQDSVLALKVPELVAGMRATLDTERELRIAAETNLQNLAWIIRGEVAPVAISGLAVEIRDEVFRLRDEVERLRRNGGDIDSWHRIQQALPEMGPDDECSLLGRTLSRLELASRLEIKSHTDDTQFRLLARHFGVTGSTNTEIVSEVAEKWTRHVISESVSRIEKLRKPHDTGFYRTLDVGERIQEGDEYCSTTGWRPVTGSVGSKIKETVGYFRRPISLDSQPPASETPPV